MSDTVYQLKKRKHLDLTVKNLWELPKEIGALSNLEFLSLQGNNLRKLPKEIGKLRNLKWLYLDRNKLEYIPQEIGKLKNLKVLSITNNRLKEFPNILDLNLEELFILDSGRYTFPDNFRDFARKLKNKDFTGI